MSTLFTDLAGSWRARRLCTKGLKGAVPASAIDPDTSMSLEGASLFSEYAEHTFVYDAADNGKIEQTVTGWSQGGCDFVWSDVLPRLVALHGRRMIPECASVLELGAGCGLVGLIASRFAALVDITDGDEEEVVLIQANCEQHSAHLGVAQGIHLEWGAAAARTAASSTLRTNAYDVILASQVVYVPAAIGLLVETMATLLAPGGVVWLYNDAVSTTSSQAECRRLLDAALAAHGFRAQAAIGANDGTAAMRLPHDVVMPHADSYLLQITRDRDRTGG